MRLRTVIFENGTQNAKEYADNLFNNLHSETSVVNVYDQRPCTQVLPVRAIPNCAVLLFADTLEDGQKVIDVLKNLNYLEKSPDIQTLIDDLVNELGGLDALPEDLESRITEIFYKY